MKGIINGSFIEFTHANAFEGKYFNPQVRAFSEDQWRAKIREMHDIGMEYLVLMATSLPDPEFQEAYFETDIYPFAKNFNCQDPIFVLLDEASKLNMKVFLSAGLYGDWRRAYENISSEEVTKRAFKAIEQLTERYGSIDSFYGWYLPDELCIEGTFNDLMVKYINRYSKFCRSLDKTKKMIIAPYGTKFVRADDKYIKTLENLDLDFIAYQDEVGVRKSTTDETKKYFESLKYVHDKAGRAKLWADLEIFEFEKDVYKSALLPADINRISKQLDSITPYCDKIICYQYLGMVNAPDTIAFCGHKDSVKLYNGYIDLCNKNK